MCCSFLCGTFLKRGTADVRLWWFRAKKTSKPLVSTSGRALIDDAVGFAPVPVSLWVGEFPRRTRGEKGQNK